MALPANINASTPADTDSPSDGDDQIRALKLALQDFLGILDNTSLTAAAFSITAAGIVTIASGGLVPAAVSGVPAQHALYRDNVAKAWIEITLSGGVPSLGDNFNFTGTITDNGVGDYTASINRDFAAADSYVVVGTSVTTGSHAVQCVARAAGSVRLQVTTTTTGAGVDPEAVTAVLYGAQ